jgi:hypothetical protein
MKTKSILEIVKNAYSQAGIFINRRQIPAFEDGLKIAHRRIIYGVMKSAPDPERKVKVATITGEVMGRYHPHGDKSIDASMYRLIKSGILAGKGNFGKKRLFNANGKAAASRYTEVASSEIYGKLFSTLMSQCQMVDAEMPGYKEPKLLKTPIPIALITGAKGIGIGANTNIPGFTAKSLMEARDANDYNLLRSIHGDYIDYKLSNLKQLWDKGHGKIHFNFKVERGSHEGLEGVFIIGNAELFRPNFGKSKTKGTINNLRVEGLVVIRDLVDRVFIGKQFKVRKITVDQIYKKCLEAAKYSDVYMLSVNKGGTIGRVPMKYWLDKTYESYINSYADYIEETIKGINRDMTIYKYLAPVGKLLIAEKSNEFIMKELDIKEWIIQAIAKKSIGSLRKSSDARYNSLNSELSKYKSMTASNEVAKIVNKL